MIEMDPDRALAVTYVPAARQAAIKALWQLDVALGRVVSGGSEPMLRQIKLVWWRDALQKLGSGRAPAEPVLEALDREVLTEGIAGEELVPLCEGWAVLLKEGALVPDDLSEYASKRGGLLFKLSARLLDHDLPSPHQTAGELWALIDLARHSGQPDAGGALAAARQRLSRTTWPGKIRFLGMLAALAERDAGRTVEQFEPQGSPARVWRMLGHRLTGR